MAERRVDEHGYERGKLEHSDLIHRQVAYKEIYLNGRTLYPKPFSEYQVHHRDGNKRNNSVGNLQIVTNEEHERIHGIHAEKSSALRRLGKLIIAGSLASGFLIGVPLLYFALTGTIAGSIVGSALSVLSLLFVGGVALFFLG